MKKSERKVITLELEEQEFLDLSYVLHYGESVNSPKIPQATLNTIAKYAEELNQKLGVASV